MEAASFSEEGDEALVDVDESYVVAAFVIAEESLSLGSCDADAGVVDVDLVVVVMLDEACFDLPAFRTFEDAVDDGVFYEGLKEKGRDHDVVELVFREVVFDLETVAEAGSFEFRVALDDVKLVRKGDELGRVVEAVAEVVGQVLDEASGCFRIASDVVGNGV